MIMGSKIIEELAFRDRDFVFKDRFQAGRLLANKLREYDGDKNVIILALPAGGVPVAYSLAKELGVSTDLLVVRKIQIS
jgi:putative phosphoribosyl transferase